MEAIDLAARAGSAWDHLRLRRMQQRIDRVEEDRTRLRLENRMLADDRLEALRRIAVLGWHHGYSVPSHEVARFLRAGYSHGQYELMMDSISAAHATRQPRR